jgi:Xaa-Pro aminopeptidase
MPLTGAAMATNSLSPHPARVRTLQADLGGAQLDALVVTHLPNLRYVTGFSGTAGAAVLTPGQCVLIVDFRYATSARELIATQPDGLMDLVIVEGTYDDTLADVLRRTAAARIGVEGASMTVNRFRKLADALTPPQPRPDVVNENPVLVATDRFVERRRAVKDSAEIETLRIAARLLSRVARQVPSFVRVGRSELEIAADIDAALRAGGFARPAFDTIVASGPNGAHPHARPGRRIVSTGDGVVLDFGGVYDGYCVDLTRTLQVGAASPDLRRLFHAVRRAHAAAIAAVRPGARPSDIDGAARTVLTGHGLGEAFGHGTGHGLGLEVHEEPRISKLPGALPDDPVVPGMVFTIEPGAYVEGLGGVRIEDDVLVTRDGCEVLTDVPIEYE